MLDVISVLISTKFSTVTRRWNLSRVLLILSVPHYRELQWPGEAVNPVDTVGITAFHSTHRL